MDKNITDYLRYPSSMNGELQEWNKLLVVCRKYDNQRTRFIQELRGCHDLYPKGIVYSGVEFSDSHTLLHYFLKFREQSVRVARILKVPHDMPTSSEWLMSYPEGYAVYIGMDPREANRFKWTDGTVDRTNIDIDYFRASRTHETFVSTVGQNNDS